jgi:hypothetical protein
MDKNKFWLGGRLFNTASPRLGTPTQHNAHSQDGRINATQGTSASWAPQRNARHVRKLGAPTHVRNANARHVHNGRHIRTSESWAPQCNARHFWLGGRLFNTASGRLGAPTQFKARPQDGHPKATQDTSARWAPQRKERHVRKLGTPTHVRNANARHVHTSTSWVPQRNARHIRKMVAQTQNLSAMKTSTQGSTRLKDELEDG